MNTLLSPQASLAVGILLIMLGISFFYKAGIAATRGTISYWAGFLPLTLVSPFLIHLPSTKNSLIKTADGVWVRTLMAPLFFIVAILSSLSGAEYVGIPAVETLNLACHGGKAGNAPIISFSKTRGFAFPLLVRSSPVLARLFNIPIDLDARHEIVPRTDQSLQQTLER